MCKNSSDMNKGNNHQGWDVLIFRQILPTSSIWNVWRTVRRMCIFISGLKKVNFGRIKDIRAHCLCASLLRTLFTSQYHTTPGIKRARWVRNIDTVVVAIFVSINMLNSLKCMVTPFSFSINHILYWFSAFCPKTKFWTWEVLILLLFLLKYDWIFNAGICEFQLSFGEANFTWRNNIASKK